MRRRAGVVGLAAVAAVAAVASVAWACTAISGVYSINPAAAPAGSTVMVTGHDFWPKEIEIRWNSMDGPVIGTTRGPDFEAQAKIPHDAAPGHYRVFATQEGSLNPEISFQVVPATSAPSDERSEVGRGEAGPDRNEAFTEPPYHPGAEGSAGAADAGASQSPSSSSSGTTGSSSSGSGPSGSGRAGGGPSGLPSSPPPFGGGGGTTGASEATTGRAGPPVASPEATGAEATPPAVSARTAAGEVAFATPWSPHALRGQGPKLNQTFERGPASRGMGAGLAFLTVGLAGLVGAGAGLSRRRRASALANHHQDQASI